MIGDYYYYHSLNKKNQIVYKEIYDSILRFESQVTIRIVFSDIEDVKTIFESIRKDNPFLYYWNSEIINMLTIESHYSQIDLYYYISKDKYLEIDKKVKANTQKLLSMVKAKDELGVVTELHDILCENVYYDIKGISDNAQKIDEITAHTMLGVILKKMAVCDGVAYAIKYLLNALNIKCIVVIGQSTAKSTQLNIDNDHGHAWNIIKINGIPSHFDLTWDINTSKDGMISYDYFSLDDINISKDHSWSDRLPACNNMSYNYYEKNNLIFEKKELAGKYIEMQLKKGMKKIDLKMNSTEKLDDIANGIMDYLVSKNDRSIIKRFLITMNYEQRIIHFDFA